MMNRKSIDGIAGAVFSATTLIFLFWVIFSEPSASGIGFLVVAIAFEYAVYRLIIRKLT